MPHLLALDQGTTSSRAIIFNESAEIVSSSQEEITPYFPQPGWVEHDALEIWETTLRMARDALAKAGLQACDVAALGITNQRETVVLWDRETSRPLHPAIVWQDRRSAPHIEQLRADGCEDWIHDRTGLILDPYFSATKIAWLLDHIPDARPRAERGELAVGTIDSWLVYKLTRGRSHIIDVSNASRTMLFNIHTETWDADLLNCFRIPPQLLPMVVPTSGPLGAIDASWFGDSIALCALVGDQQAALFGQGCFSPGMAKCTYGTGCFLLQFLGSQPQKSKNRLLTTIAWKLHNEPVQYALEGSVFAGGAVIQWLRDGLGLIPSCSAIDDLATQVPHSNGVFFVPAFTGLGAPYWDSSARAAIMGLTRDSTAAHICRAALDGIAFQVSELVLAMKADSHQSLSALRVDGGLSASNLLMQIQADQLGISVERSQFAEATALGAALLAGLGAGIWPNIHSFAQIQKIDRTFSPTLDTTTRNKQHMLWKQAIAAARKFTFSK